MVLHKNVTVAAVMTAPRYEAVWCRNKIEFALNQAGIPLTVSGGVFYGQCMQRMLQQLLKQGVDYALTIDFDSVFTDKHIQRLLSIVAQEDEIDALCAIQPMRGKERILGSRSKESSVEWTGKPIQLRTGHFGLTVLDLKKLANVEKPWFVCVPDSNGEFTDERIDDDVYFWRQWEKAGNTLYVDPGCRIGHMEEMISVLDDNMQIQCWKPDQWESDFASTVD